MTTSTSAPKSKTLLWIAAACAVAAVLDHAYLLREHYELRFGESSGSSLCNINDLFSCAAVSASKYSELFGIPIALFGLAANAVLAILIFAFTFTDDEAKPSARKILLLVAGGIALTSIVMGSISGLMLGKLCLFCIAAYLLSFITFASLWIGLKPGHKSDKSVIPPRALSPADFKVVGILGVIALVGVSVSNDNILRSYNSMLNSTSLAREAQEAVASWTVQSLATIDTANALEVGAPAETAKMSIVEFADYRCSHCKHAGPKLKAFVGAHSDVRLQFLAWPLDGECNTKFSRSNGASCLLARLTYCALKGGGQKAGWASNGYIFDNQEKFETKDSVRSFIPALAAAVGSDAKTLETCADSPDAKSAVEKQAAVGSGLNLQGTPTIYVNGKRLPSGQSLMILEAVHKAITGQ